MGSLVYATVATYTAGSTCTMTTKLSTPPPPGSVKPDPPPAPPKKVDDYIRLRPGTKVKRVVFPNGDSMDTGWFAYKSITAVGVPGSGGRVAWLEVVYQINNSHRLVNLRTVKFVDVE